MNLAVSNVGLFLLGATDEALTAIFIDFIRTPPVDLHGDFSLSLRTKIFG
jgi:hypothetical protein